MSSEYILQDLPFDTLEDLVDWSRKYLKDKEVKLSDVIDFFTIINGNQTIIYDMTTHDDDFGTIVNMRFTLQYAEYRVKLYSSAGKVSTYIIREIEVF